MSSYIKIGDYRFSGPFTGTSMIENSSGLYAILDNTGSSYEVIDIGETATLKTRIEGHERQPCWQSNKDGRLVLAVLYTPHKQSSTRTDIEDNLRQQYNPPCGQR
jgi:hypothetical protein